MIYDKAQYEYEKGYSDALEGAPPAMQTAHYLQGWEQGQPQPLDDAQMGWPCE